MSSAEDDYNEHDRISLVLPGSKKRRIQRACDICRRKKIRCDGSQMPGNRCSNCIAYNFDCTYVEAAKKRGPPKGYVQSLENRLEKMEKLLQKVCPDVDFTHELGGGQMDKEWSKCGQSVSSMTTAVMGTPSKDAPSPEDDLVPSDDEELIQPRLSESIRGLTINPMQLRFFGKSSGVMFLQKAIDLKKEYTGSCDYDNFRVHNRPEFDSVFPTYAGQWELAGKDIAEPQYIFPDVDLGIALSDLYFTYINPLYPVLHKPTFQRSVANGVHLTDPSFGAVFLLVCSLGSRWSDDPRVFLDGTNSEHSCGWKYFEQVQMIRKSLLNTPCLHDLQVYCLSVLFLQGSSAPQACWTIVGIGVRLAQDVGAHRRKVYGSKPTVEDELWKRAFWVLVTLDRINSATLGRPCGIQDEDIDLDFPIECDDEYWENPDADQAFKQPLNKPSSVSYFVNFLKLHQILAFALRTIYSINKSKVLLGFVGQQWEQHIVSELDSALNKWIDAVPDHLRWDPSREDDHFFTQSACLYAHYYHLQILIHRPFIPSPRKPSPLSFPSLAICTNAARSCSHVIDILRKRSHVASPCVQMSAFSAGIVLLLNIWGGKRSGLSMDPNKEMADVHKCMAVLRQCERRWHSAGRLWDVLYELASAGDLPLPQPSPTITMKRERDSDSPRSSAYNRSPTPLSLEVPRDIAGSRRSTQGPSHSQQRNLQKSPTLPNAGTPFNLPVYSDDLGRLPLHGQANLSATRNRTTPLDSGGMWYSSAGSESSMSRTSTGTRTSTPSDVLGSVGGGAYHEASETPYSMDHLFYDQMSTQFPTPFPGPGTPSQYGEHDHSLQAFMDGSVHPRHAQNPGMLPHTVGTHDHPASPLDNDTMAMWSNAPTGFELQDWGTYITNVSGIAYDDSVRGQNMNVQRH